MNTTMGWYNRNMTIVLTFALITVASAAVCFAEMRITTYDGRVLNVPVNSRDIRSIEFTAAESTLSLEGIWNSSIGFQYHIKQSGNSFTWNVTTPVSEQGRGTISGSTINASWSGSNGSGNAIGKISGTDSLNRAKRIEWNNGVVFTR